MIVVSEENGDRSSGASGYWFAVSRGGSESKAETGDIDGSIEGSAGVGVGASVENLETNGEGDSNRSSDSIGKAWAIAADSVGLNEVSFASKADEIAASGSASGDLAISGSAIARSSAIGVSTATVWAIGVSFIDASTIGVSRSASGDLAISGSAIARSSTVDVSIRGASAILSKGAVAGELISDGADFGERGWG